MRPKSAKPGNRKRQPQVLIDAPPQPLSHTFANAMEAVGCMHIETKGNKVPGKKNTQDVMGPPLNKKSKRDSANTHIASLDSDATKSQQPTLEVVNPQSEPNSTSSGSSTHSDLKITEIIETVCAKPGINEDNVADAFFRELVSCLFAILNELPHCKSKIHRILNVLIKYGVNLSNENGATKDPESDLQLFSFNSVEYSDPRLNYAFKLLEIDRQISALTKQKFELYPKILKPNSDDIINLDCEKQLDTCLMEFNTTVECVNNSILPVESVEITHANSTSVEMEPLAIVKEESHNMEREYFSRETVAAACRDEINKLLKVKQELLSNKSANDTIETTNTDIEQPNQGSLPETPTTPVVRIRKEFLCTPQIESEEELDGDSSFASAILDIPKTTSKITCMKVYKNSIFAGCYDGSLMWFSLAKRKLIDLELSHDAAITSIIIWEKRVITASLDGRMKCYNLTTCTRETVRVNQPICATDEHNGILYVGTQEGHVYRYNIRSMTQLASPVQVCSKDILYLKYLTTDNLDSIALVPKHSPVSFRKVDGAFLRSFRDLNEIKIVCTNSLKNRIIFAKDDCLMAFVSKKNKSQDIRTQTLNHGVTYIEEYKGFWFVAGNDSHLYLYKDFKQLGRIAIPSGIPLAIAFWDDYVVVSTTKTKLALINIPEPILALINESPNKSSS